VEPLVVVSIVLFGLVIGSFLCVIIDRLPVPLDEPSPTGDLWDTRPWPEVLGGTSRCSSCGAGVRPRDNIPVLGWLLLRGRCRDCGERIPAFHPFVELAVPLLALLACGVLDLGWPVAIAWWLVVLGVPIAVIDLRTMIVPTRLVWPAFFGGVVLTVVIALAEGRPLALVSALVGTLTLAGPLFVLWYVLPSHLGFGDVRLCTFLGWMVGFASTWVDDQLMVAVLAAVITMTLGSLGGIVLGVALRAGFGVRLPFGPTLVAGAFVTVVWAQPILEPFLG